MEVKRDSHAENSSERRQVAAQMAAFIYEQYLVLTDEGTDEELEKAPERKGKQANAKEEKSKMKMAETSKRKIRPGLQFCISPPPNVVVNLSFIKSHTSALYIIGISTSADLILSACCSVLDS